MRAPGLTPAAVVLGRAPVPGRCKTRLQPRLGPHGCARLQSALLAHAAQWASAVAAPGRAFLAYDGPGPALGARDLHLLRQADGHLGDRLRHACARVFSRHDGPLLLVGTDMPTLAPAHAEEALGALAAGADVAFAPAADGGWWLVALARRADAAFDIDPAAWGGPEALERCVAACERAGLAVTVLPTLEHDLDLPADADRALADPRTPSRVRAALGRADPLVSVLGGPAPPATPAERWDRPGRADPLGDIVVLLSPGACLPAAAYATLRAAWLDPGLVGGTLHVAGRRRPRTSPAAVWVRRDALGASGVRDLTAVGRRGLARRVSALGRTAALRVQADGLVR